MVQGQFPLRRQHEEKDWARVKMKSQATSAIAKLSANMPKKNFFCVSVKQKILSF